MKKGNINRWMKRVTAGLLSAALVMTGALMLPKTTEAAAVDGVEYEKMTKTDSAPVKAGYLFGGWYKDNKGSEAVRQDETYTGDTYAKFVPSYVLSVKAQVDAGTAAEDKKLTNMRILTSVDSVDYQYVGVQVGLGNKNVTEYTTTKAYDNLLIGSGESTTKSAASAVFGAASKYFVAWKLPNIQDVNDDKIVYVRPFWVTMDGTRVYGLAKYLHVEDSYKDYISIPVNLMSEADTVAAGFAKMEYNSDDLEFVEVENGRVSNDEMAENHSVAGIVKIVGNEAEIGTYSAEESLFANVRFKLKNPGSLYTTDENNINKRQKFFSIGISDAQFKDWDEASVNADVWGIQY